VTPLRDSLARVSAALDELAARFALVGGLAVSVRTEPRFTRDIDLAVVVDDDDEAQALVRDLRARGFRATGHLEQEATGRLATVRVTETAASAPVIDLMFASTGIEREIVDAAEDLEALPGMTVPVARLPHLLALKVLARDDRARPQDSGDARALVDRAEPGDLDEARRLLGMITARGFARGRDLDAELARVL
jgi:predicted nucleotidyltransferase